MHGPIGARARWLSILVGAVLLLAWQLAAAEVAAAAGGPLDSSVYIACGYGDTTPTPPANCPTLDQAWAAVLSQDAASAAPATLVLLPGDYCSLDVRDPNNTPPGTIDRRITIVGAGAKPADVAFLWNSTDCGDSPPSAAISFSDSFIEPLTLRNVSVDGSGGGPTTGISAHVFENNSQALTFRDVLVQDEATGVTVLSDNMQVTNSSFVNNQIGASMAGEWSVDGSTIAGNTTTGLSTGGDGHLENDTIAHNGIGVAAPCCGNTLQVVNTIVGGNTSDCSPTSDWENASFNTTNLLAAECITANAAANDDITLTDSIGSLDTADGITPFIAPPNQAIGAASSSVCGSGVGTDQLEETESGLSACDIGSVDTENTGSTPSAGPQPGAIDFEHIPAGQTAPDTATLKNIGAGLLQVTSVEVTGAGLDVESDGCTYQVLLPQQECFVTVGASPASPGDLTGTLKFLNNAVEQDVSLTATGVAALAAPPSAPSVTVSQRKADLTWPPSPSENFQQNDFGLFYVMKESVDGGSSFSYAGEVDDADTGQITGLTPGTAYEFEVCTEDYYTQGKSDAADAPCSAPTAMVTPLDTSALTHPSSTTIKDGGSVKLSTTLSDGTTHKTVAGATVTLLSRPASGGTFHSAGTATTDSTGIASLTVKPSKNTRYEWQYAAAGAHDAATSSSWTVTVAQAVAAKLVHTSIHRGTTGEIFGTIAPSATGLSVSLQYEHHGKWVTLTTAKTKKQRLPDHQKVVGYLLKHTFASKGTVHLRVSRAATATNAAGVSKELTLKVT